MLQKTALFLAVIGIGVGTVGLIGVKYAWVTKGSVDSSNDYFFVDKMLKVPVDAAGTLSEQLKNTRSVLADSEVKNPAHLSSNTQKSTFLQTPDAVLSVFSKPTANFVTTASSSTSNVGTPSATLSVGHSQFVYMRGLVGGWIQSTSGVQTAFNAPSMSGSPDAASLVLGAAKDTVRWDRPGGVYIQEYDGVLIWIKGAIGGEQARITLYDTSGTPLGSANIADYLSTKKISSIEYQRAFIPFQVINPKRSNIGSMSFGSNRSVKFFVDSVSFSNIPEGMPLAGFLYNTHPTVFDSDFRNTWELENTGISSKIISTDEADSGYALLARLPKKGDTISLVNTLNMFSSSLKSFVFNMRGRDAYDHHVTITFYDENGLELGQVRLKSYTTKEKEDFNKTKKITIPLSDLGVARNYIKKITFTAEEGQIQELRLSDMRFEL